MEIIYNSPRTSMSKSSEAVINKQGQGQTIKNKARNYVQYWGGFLTFASLKILCLTKISEAR